jgi:hypothetical protein
VSVDARVCSSGGGKRLPTQPAQPGRNITNVAAALRSCSALKRRARKRLKISELRPQALFFHVLLTPSRSLRTVENPKPDAITPLKGPHARKTFAATMCTNADSRATRMCTCKTLAEATMSRWEQEGGALVQQRCNDGGAARGRARRRHARASEVWAWQQPRTRTNNTNAAHNTAQPHAHSTAEATPHLRKHTTNLHKNDATAPTPRRYSRHTRA